MRPISLSPRLETVARLVPAGVRFADIGTDHAYLPVWLLQQGVIDRAIAADLNPGPLDRARENARRYGLTDRIDFRLGDGLRSAVISTLRSLILVSLFLLVLPPVIGDAGIWLSLPLADLATLPFSLIFFLRKGRVSAVRKHRLLELEAAALSQDILS